MSNQLVLASGSAIRRQLLENAGVPVETARPRIDEDLVKAAMLAEGAPPRDLADTLAELKARKISDKRPGALVLGCDQVLALGREVFSKPETPNEAIDHIRRLRGETHMLLSAAVLVRAGEPVWRHVGVARLTMRDVPEDYLAEYVARNWDSIRDSVGGYKLEEEGVRLFSRIQGDYFTILGLPLLELLGHLTLSKEIPG